MPSSPTASAPIGPLTNQVHLALLQRTLKVRRAQLAQAESQVRELALEVFILEEALPFLDPAPVTNRVCSDAEARAAHVVELLSAKWRIGFTPFFNPKPIRQRKGHSKPKKGHHAQ